MATTTRRPPRTLDAIDRRVGILFGLFMLLLVGAVARAAYLGLFRARSLQVAATRQQVAIEPVPATRGMITDRSGVVLALSEAADEVVADPYLVIGHDQPAKVAAQIAPLLGLSATQTLAGLTAAHTGYKVLAYDVPAANATRIATMRIDGISLVPVEQRVYPRNTLAAQVLGWVGSNRPGLAETGRGGLEYLFNSALSGRAGVRRTVNDAVGQAIATRMTRPVVNGRTIQLTISAPLQAEVEQVLAGVGAEWHPKAATAIVINPDSSQILALANWPPVNANDIGATPIDDTEDYGVGFSYEPGSTFKAFTVSGALEDGLVTPQTAFDVPPYLDAYGHIVTDAESHGYETLTVGQILKYSSNIGAVLIGQRMGATNFSQWVTRFGFGRPTGVALPGEQQGVIRPLDRYDGVSMYNFPFGQGQAVTPMQMVAGYSAIADGGILRTPQIIESVGGAPVREPHGTRVISATVAAEVRDMLRGVLNDGGTASNAWIKGYDMAGKTGTAQIAVNGNYSSTEYVASFIGMVPASNPKLVIAVVVDQPQGEIYGGSVAAPAFQKIVGWAVPYFGIDPCPAPCPPTAYNPTASLSLP